MAKNGTPDNIVIQKTLKISIPYIGLGAKSGQIIYMVIHPARANAGIYFVRKDVPPGQGIIHAHWYDLVEPGLMELVYNQHGHSMGTIKPLVTTLRKCGIDNALIEVNGPEVPVDERRTHEIAFMIKHVGVVEQRIPLSDTEN